MPTSVFCSCPQVVFVVIAVVLWVLYNRILLPMADRLEQVLLESSHGCITFAPASLLPASQSLPRRVCLQFGRVGSERLSCYFHRASKCLRRAAMS